MAGEAERGPGAAAADRPEVVDVAEAQALDGEAERLQSRVISSWQPASSGVTDLRRDQFLRELEVPTCARLYRYHGCRATDRGRARLHPQEFVDGGLGAGLRVDFLDDDGAG